MKGDEKKQERTERKRKERNKRETFHYKAMTKQTHKHAASSTCVGLRRDLRWVAKPALPLLFITSTFIFIFHDRKKKSLC